MKFSIETNDLVKKFGDFTAVDHITFQVNQGEIFGFLGANGAGKTTAMRMLCGLSYPTSGKANVAGFDVYKEQEKIKKSIGYMSQKFSLYENLTVKENIEFYSGVYGLKQKEIHEKLKIVLRELDMEEMKNKLVKSIPLGWKQKLAFSTAIFHEPKIVFLDEPTGGVDPITRKEFWTHINSLVKKGVSIMVTTHFMNEAEYCDKIMLIYKGKAIANGTPDELKNLVGSQVSMQETFISLIKQYDKEEK